MFFQGWYLDEDLTEAFSVTDLADGLTLYAKCAEAVNIKLYGLDPDHPYSSTTEKVVKNSLFSVDDYVIWERQAIFGCFTTQFYTTEVDSIFVASEDKEMFIKYATAQSKFVFQISNGEATITGSYLGSTTTVFFPSYYLDESTTTIYPVTALADYLMKDNENITGVSFPSSIKVIGASAFESCGLLTSARFVDGIEDIGTKAFYQSDALDNISLPSSITHIGKDAFYRTLFYRDDDNWTGTVLYSGTNLISGYKYLNAAWDLFNRNIDRPTTGDYTIRTGTKTIADYAFEDCSSLTSVYFPTSVKYIGEGSFYNCDSLTGVTLPILLEKLGDLSFSECGNLNSVTIDKLVPPEAGTNIFYKENDFIAVYVYVSAESLEDYKAASGWSTYSARILAQS